MSEIEIEHNMVGSYYTLCIRMGPFSQTNVETCTEGGALGDNGKGAYVAMEHCSFKLLEWNLGFIPKVVLF